MMTKSILKSAVFARILILTAALLVARSVSHEVPLQADRQEEIRALWVDGYHGGIRTPREADHLVSRAKEAGFNTLIVQVRCNADSYYTRSFEPPVEDYRYDPRFDALDYVIDRAHRQDLEVHAWINALPLWRSPFLPSDPKHLFYHHGPTAEGAENWLTCSPDGESSYLAGYYLDPGHPKAAEYVAAVYLNIVRNYAVDGIHFDYIRYPETEERLPRGANVGYNPVSLQRYRRATGREGIPAAGDSDWNHWRRQQVTQLVRRIYIEAKEINPRIKVSAALVSWGSPPRRPEDFLDTTPGQRVFQDWDGWLREGILDLAIPMNYIREGDPLTGNWFDGWVRWEKTNKHGRHLAIGIGAYLNTPGSTLEQIARARRPVGGHKADGVSVFSFAEMELLDASTYDSHSSGANGTGDFAGGDAEMSPLGNGAYSVFAPFDQPAPIPPMSWLERPEHGMVAGILQDDSGRPLDGARISVKRTGLLSPFRSTHHTETDGNGFFGFAQLLPGEYRLRVDGVRLENREVVLEIAPGRVSRTLLTVPKIGSTSRSPTERNAVRADGYAAGLALKKSRCSEESARERIGLPIRP